MARGDAAPILDDRQTQRLNPCGRLGRSNQHPSPSSNRAAEMGSLASRRRRSELPKGALEVAQPRASQPKGKGA